MLKPKSEQMNVIGVNIKQLRLKNGWSQGEVAKRLKISIPAFSKIETGITDINISRLEQIARLFGVPTMQIISRDVGNIHADSFTDLAVLKHRLAIQDDEIIHLQKKIIELYEQIKSKN